MCWTMIATLFESGSSIAPNAASLGICAMACSPSVLYIRYILTKSRSKTALSIIRLPVIQLPDYTFRDRLELQIRRAFVDLSDLRVTIELLDRVVLHEAVAAVQVDRE